MLVAVLNNFIEHYFTRKMVLACGVQTAYRDDILFSFSKQTQLQTEKSFRSAIFPNHEKLARVISYQSIVKLLPNRKLLSTESAVD